MMLNSDNKELYTWIWISYKYTKEILVFVEKTQFFATMHPKVHLAWVVKRHDITIEYIANPH